jgi:ABC-2 type transport system permease protein
MLNKIWTIAWKDIYTTFRDRNVVLIMIAAPLAVATIIALAFGGIGSGSSPIENIPVAIVNQDTGGEFGNLGDIYLSAFIPPAESSAAGQLPDCALADEAVTQNAASSTNLQDLTNAVKVDDVAAAKAGVDSGQYTAAIIIPPDFTERLTYSQNKPIEATGIEVYANGGREVAAGIIRSIVDGITNQIVTGNITIAATIDSLVQRAQRDPAFGLQFLAASTSGSFNPDFNCAFTPALNTLTVKQEPVEGSQISATTALLVMFGSAQAVFFTLFTGQGGVQGFFEERRQWTLQRLVISPTPRIAILLGKLGGTLVTCVLQLIFLFIALTVVGSILNGGFVLIWGNNLLLVFLVILGASLSATGLGTLLAGIARTPEQGQIFGSLINIGMSVLGGAFGFQLPESVAQFSILYWGTNAFQKLANGRGDIGLNLLVLALFGGVLFAVGFWFFNRRLEV